MCFVWLSEQTVTFTLYIIKRLVFITEVESVYCAVRSESSYNTDTSRPQKVKVFVQPFICLYLPINRHSATNRTGYTDDKANWHVLPLIWKSFNRNICSFGVKLKVACGVFSALQPVGRLYPCPIEFPSFISRSATHHIGTRDLC